MQPDQCPCRDGKTFSLVFLVGRRFVSGVAFEARRKCIYGAVDGVVSDRKRFPGYFIICVCVLYVCMQVLVCVCVCVVPRPVCLDKRYNRVEMELSTFNCHMQTDTKGRQRPELCEGVWMLAGLCFNNENLNHCRQTAYHSSTNKPKLVLGTDFAIL